MAWIVGIDEAGYGPNLGPFVMTAVAWQVPDDLAGANLWRVLKQAVRRHTSRDDGRLLIEDSKLVYSASLGIEQLERGVLATLLRSAGRPINTLAGFLSMLSPGWQEELTAELWYAGDTSVPNVNDLTHLVAAGESFAAACNRHHLALPQARSVTVCPRRFNTIIDQWGSKGAVLGDTLAQLIDWSLAAADDGEPIYFQVDKHGGRNTYAALLQHCFPQGFVTVREEGMDRSLYEVIGLGREVRLTFEPRADGRYFNVALASMASKYARELLMLEFNRFWQDQTPGLRPTAGYPGDAARFFAEIRPAVERLGIPEEAVWRRR